MWKRWPGGTACKRFAANAFPTFLGGTGSNGRSSGYGSRTTAPAAEALERSRSCILDWWDRAYRRDLVLRNQFDDEARSALPAAVFGMQKRLTPEAIFEGLMVQQMVLKRDQQLAVWTP